MKGQKYIVSCTTYYGKKTYHYYGMVMVKESERGLEILKEYSTLTSDKSKAAHLVSLCNELNVSEFYADEIVEDFLCSENREV